MLLRFLLERVFTEDREVTGEGGQPAAALFHPDVAALRRSLCDERYVDRERGLYVRRVAPAGAKDGHAVRLAAAVLRRRLRRRAYSPPTIGSMTP